MYLVNQRIVLWIKMAVLLGVPLLTSFVVPWLSFWQIPSALLVLVAFYLNNLYPDRIYLDEKVVKIKLFLCNEWLEYERQQIKLQPGKHCLFLYVDGKCHYQLSMEHLSVRLYKQLKELLEFYPDKN